MVIDWTEGRRGDWTAVVGPLIVRLEYRPRDGSCYLSADAASSHDLEIGAATGIRDIEQAKLWAWGALSGFVVAILKGLGQG